MVHKIKKIPKTLFVFASLFVLVLLPTAQLAHAATSQELQQQINALNAQNAGAQSSLGTLAAQAGSYQAAIGQLQGQIWAMQQQIDANVAKQAQIQQQIVDNQAEIEKQRAILSADVKAMYVDGVPTTIEVLATSKNLSEFVDKQEYRNSVQNKLQNTLKKIAELQRQLQVQKTEVENLVNSQKQQRAQLDASRAQQAQLLAYNQSQQAEFNGAIAANSAKIAELQRQQAALNTRGSQRVFISGDERGGACDNGSGNGGYYKASGTQGNVCDSPKDSIGDWYGIENRECASYAYWYFIKVEGNFDFYTTGDAKYWASNSNYGWSYSPQVGAIGVIESGTWGHVVIVHATPGQTYKGQSVPDGKVLVSEMNYDFNGYFRYSLRDTASMKYINPRH